MDSIQYLLPGTKIRIVGDLLAEVEQNPRDGVWLLARCPDPGSDVAGELEPFLLAASQSPHSWTCLKDSRTGELLVILHADDILGIWE
ncbi:MAG TPA: hypothetical protein VGP19_06530 [Candidatus Acidoferrales bacterium]|jgi:hypothetical protein|nr:hypothetical protein [Candidatus Acidoferrales bacterium]